MDLISVCLYTKTALKVVTIAQVTFTTYHKVRTVYRCIRPNKSKMSSYVMIETVPLHVDTEFDFVVL